MLLAHTKGTTQPLRILIVEDNPLDAELEVRELRRAAINMETRIVSTQSGFRSALLEFDPDVILCDFSFPDFDGQTALTIARLLRPQTPFIFVTGTISEDRAVIAVQHGAVDYVLKTSLIRLAGAVLRAVDEAVERERRLTAEARVMRLSRVRDVLAAANSAMLRYRNSGDLFREACRIAVEIGGLPVAFIVSQTQERGSFELAALAGLEIKDLVDGDLRRLAADPRQMPGTVAEAFRTRAAAIVNDLAEEPEVSFRSQLLALGIRSVGSFPLVVGDASVGVLTMCSLDHGFFDDEEVALLNSMANNLSFALDLAEKQNRVDYLSYYDALTGIPNRTFFFERLAQQIDADRRAEKMTGLILLDLARFSVVNNTLGEHTGDGLLRRVASRLSRELGSSWVARITGDRFALCLPALSDLRPLSALVSEEGIALLRRPFTVDGRPLRVSARAGCAVFPNDGDEAETLFRNAEAALQNAKSSGATYRLYARDLNARLAKRLELEARLQRACEQNEFLLYYQPQIKLATNKLVGLEALLRWQDPETGTLVSPGEFIPLLEETGLIMAVGRWALAEAGRQYRAWRDAGLRPPRIAVNISIAQLRQDRLVDDVRAAIEAARDDGAIEVEITESMLMENFESAIAKLSKIQRLGVKIALDDFGTGYSSLAYIHRLPISMLKIDRSFVSGIDRDADKISIASTIVSLGKALKLNILAEGVESDEELRILQSLRCDEVQGYLTGRPLPAADVVARFERG